MALSSRLPRRSSDHLLTLSRPEFQAPETFSLSSNDFEDGAAIPSRHRGKLFGSNISPELHWSEPAAGVASLLLVIEDPDTPANSVTVHGVALIDPGIVRGALPGGALSAKAETPGLTIGKGMMKLGYAGPLPPKGHGAHRYVFSLYALAGQLNLSRGFRLKDALPLLPGRVIARAQLIGTYER